MPLTMTSILTPLKRYWWPRKFPKVACESFRRMFCKNRLNQCEVSWLFQNACLYSVNYISVMVWCNLWTDPQYQYRKNVCVCDHPLSIAACGDSHQLWSVFYAIIVWIYGLLRGQRSGKAGRKEKLLVLRLTLNVIFRLGQKKNFSTFRHILISTFLIFPSNSDLLWVVVGARSGALNFI
jgi:hypothetical protein